MSIEFIANLSDEDANKLGALLIERLPAHHGKLGSALLKILECDLPDGLTEDKFNETVIRSAIEVISEDN